MSESALVPAELEAIWAVLRESGEGAPAAEPAVCLPSQELVALVFDRARRAMCAALPAPTRLTIGALRERPVEPVAWERVANAGGAPALALRVGPELVERCALRRCGEPTSVYTGTRTPTAVSRRLFDDIGAQVFGALVDAWRKAGLPALQEAHGEVAPAATWRAALPLRWDGDVRGSGELVLSAAAVAALLAQERRTRAELAAVMSSIEVPVIATLAALPLPRRASGQIAIGDVWSLPAAALERTEIIVGGSCKARGVPVVLRGALAVLVNEATAAVGASPLLPEPLMTMARQLPPDPAGSTASDDGAVCVGLADEPTGARRAIPAPPEAPPESGPLPELVTRLGDVPLELTIELGRVSLPLGELLQLLSPGCIISLGKAPTAPLELRVRDKLVARAEAVTVGDAITVRVTEIVPGGR